MKEVTDIVCNLNSSLCDGAICLLAGCESYDNYNQSRLGVLFSKFPAGTSVKNMVHFKQLVHNKRVLFCVFVAFFCCVLIVFFFPQGCPMYSYGLGNKKHYGTNKVLSFFFLLFEGIKVTFTFYLLTSTPNLAPCVQCHCLHSPPNVSFLRRLRQDGLIDFFSFFCFLSIVTNYYLLFFKADPQDVESLIVPIQGNNPDPVVLWDKIPVYGHGDFVWGLDAHEVSFSSIPLFF